MGDSLRPGRGAKARCIASYMGPRRFRRLRRRVVLGQDVPVARGPVRLLGLALLSRQRAGPGLLIPRCRSVHTFGMRFAVDLVFLDQRGRPLRILRGLGPLRVCACRGAAAVLETPSRRIGAPGSGRRPGDPDKES
jgi:uncharacterized protein